MYSKHMFIRLASAVLTNWQGCLTEFVACATVLERPMSDLSARLDLPFIAPSQAQKHVTHNEAVQRLDLLVQMALDGFEATEPPAAPETGARFALGTGATGVWAGQDGKIAAFLGEAWMFVTPQEGWIAAERGGTAVRIYRDGGWRGFPDRTDALGIATQADAVNRLSVAAAATLLSHAGAGHQLKINKAQSDDTASLVFQSGFAGHAEMGLAGDDDFSIKVSADGTTWTEALRVDAQTARISGAAVQSAPTDNAAERLLKVGAFGLGTAISLTASDMLDTLVLSGLYYNPSAGNTSGNSYPISSAGALLVIARSATNVVQEFTSYGGTSAASALRKFVRSWGTGGWSPWLELYHSGRVMGPVSLSDGVPTGAIIEHQFVGGNGEYTRFANGTQICGTTVALSTSGETTWTYPAQFFTAPRVAAVLTGSQAAFARTLSNSNLSIQIGGFNTSGTRVSGFAYLLAIGRWI